MEVVLGVYNSKNKRNEKCKVLILVLVEVVLGEIKSKTAERSDSGLNPCFSGSCSWSISSYRCKVFETLVLILVLVEVVLGAADLTNKEVCSLS